MDPLELSVLAATALVTAAISGVIGMAGGIALLSVMLLFMDPAVAIPLHGVVQLLSNSSRAWIQRRHVRLAILWRYALLLLPTGFLGLAVLRQVPAEGMSAAIGVFVLLATWRPHWLLLGVHPERTHPTRRFVWLGAGVGFLNTTVGATGPLIAPFFLNLRMTRHEIVGSKAGCQTAGHLAKLVVFGSAGFDFAPHLPLLAVLCALVVVGTWVGSRILDRVDETAFERLYKGVLTLVALRLVVVDGWEALR